MSIDQQKDQLNNIPKNDNFLLIYKKNKITIWLVFAILCIFFLFLTILTLISEKAGKQISSALFFGEKKDDWQFDQNAIGETNDFMKSASITMESASNIGVSTGGAKDIDNFRENIKKNYLPIPSDITYEGIFYDYYFDTGKKDECHKLFCPSYSYAVSQDPFSKKEEYYLSVGLNSGIKEDEFKRKKLNLVIVLDISGSMNSPFDKYYYDNPASSTVGNTEDEKRSKMEMATESIVNMLDYLNEDDRFGIVLYDDDAYLAKPIDFFGKTDLDKLKDHIKSIKPQNGTNMSAGLKRGAELFSEVNDGDYEYENRIIFLTDAMPNLGETNEDDLMGIIEKSAENKIYSTLIGVGVDFNTDLVESITKVKGANYYSVHSAADFKKRLNDEFEFMVTPLAFDLKLSLEAPGYQIEKVFGSPEADLATGEVMKVNTLFPSDSKDGENKGGLVLLKLKRLNDNGNIRLIASYESRDGAKEMDEVTINFVEQNEFYSNMGIRKGIVLARYASLLKNWTIDERKGLKDKKAINSITKDTGVMLPPEIYSLGEWERKSSPLLVSQEYQTIFDDFVKYLSREADIINDKKFDEELVLLNTIIKAGKNSEEANLPFFTDSNNCYLACKNSGYNNGNCLLDDGNQKTYFKLGACNAIKNNTLCASGQCICYCY